MGNVCGPRRAVRRHRSPAFHRPIPANDSDREARSPAPSPKPRKQLDRDANEKKTPKKLSDRDENESKTPKKASDRDENEKAPPKKMPDRNVNELKPPVKDQDEDDNNNNIKNFEPIQKFIGYMLSKGVAALKTEFEDLKPKTVATKEQCSAFHMEANQPKNRYKDVKCPDDSRVILNELSMGTDYIHANYVGTPKNPKRFICTQGPLPDTFVDFWNMVWQEKTEFIVMLCNFTELGKPKCGQYFPMADGETMTAGNLNITCDVVALEKWPGSLYARQFTLARSDSPQKRTVTHLHWESWPDRGVPPIDFTIQKLLETVCRSDKPVVVHCSAGIGRTGTTVAVQIVTELMESGQSLDTGLAPFLVKMRKQRAGSVQTDQQYIFIHRLLLERYSSDDDKENPNYVKFIKDYDAMMG